MQADQNVFDILLQTTGCIEGIFDLIATNPLVLSEVSANINMGDNIVIPKNIRSNNTILQNITKRKLIIATGAEYQEGIGYWSIGVDFIIT